MTAGSALPPPVPEILDRARTIAVLGAHVREEKPAFYVPDYLYGQGYRMLPVNPHFAGRELWGEPIVATLADLAAPVDGVVVFRRSEALPDHRDQLLDLEPAPQWVWFQLGIRNDAVAAALAADGITVVQDRCMLVDHRRWRGGSD